MVAVYTRKNVDLSQNGTLSSTQHSSLTTGIWNLTILKKTRRIHHLTTVTVSLSASRPNSPSRRLRRWWRVVRLLDGRNVRTTKRRRADATIRENPQESGLAAANYAPANFAGLIGLERLLLRLVELFAILDDRQPERGDTVVEVTRSMAVTLDHRLGAELFQAGTR